MEDTNEYSRRKLVVPVWEKSCLTLEEAVAYSGIGIIMDPTTAGLGDSERAMSYVEPWDDSVNN